jgi:hypothetical protein
MNSRRVLFWATSHFDPGNGLAQAAMNYDSARSASSCFGGPLHFAFSLFCEIHCFPPVFQASFGVFKGDAQTPFGPFRPAIA